MKNETKKSKKINLELEILELESKLAPGVGVDPSDPKAAGNIEGAEC